MSTGAVVTQAQRVLSEDEAAAVRRGVPDPGVRLPQVALPTLAVWVVSLGLWVVATVAAVRALDGAISAWWLAATVPVHALVTFAMFTVLHESVHHAAGRLTWVNEALGRAAMPFVAAWGSFPMIRYLHIEHHRHTNEDTDTDPDAWTEHGPTWQLPLRWLVMDLWYARFYVPRLPLRPRAEQVGFTVNLVVVLGAIAALVATGHGLELLVVYVVPQRLGVGLLAWWFDWLPHHDLGTTAREDRFRATRVRVGWERVMTPLMFGQNYHLVHHIHPTIPFYRYVQAWQGQAADYLGRDVPIATAWGTALSTGEYAAWRRITEPLGAAPSGRQAFHPLTVTEVRPLTDRAVSITLDVPADLREAFTPRAGQHVVVRATVDGRELRRSYSLCSVAGSGVLRIAVKRVDGGAFSTWATTALRAGDTLEVAPPSGSFVLTEAPAKGRHLGAVAAGSGITPVLSVLATALAAEPASRATLVYANTSAETTMFADELAMLTRQHEGRLTVVHVQSAGTASDSGAERVVPGRLTPDLLDALVDEVGPVDAWWLCGPEALTDEATQVLALHGAPVHRELFTTRAAVVDDAVVLRPATVTVTLDGRTSTLDTAGDESLLEAALRARLDAPYSCAGGACGTCRAFLRTGSVHMSQSPALTADELDAGWVLTCQSRPTSDAVHLDYDGPGRT